MYDVSCKLLSITSNSDSIGTSKPTVTKETEIPIIKVEDVYAKEFYQAREQGYKPTLRLRISSLNYDNQPELIYRGIRYTIIRVDNSSYDELILVCERKIKNV